MKRKVCIVTGTRAEYGLLFWLLKGIAEDTELILQLVVTGMHLSPEFGLTYKQIESDGFRIDKKVETLLSSDTPIGISKSIGLGVIGISEALADLQPDLVVLLGDRFEIFAAAVSAMISRIPIAHCHGGESTEGVIDESIRHSITKMSQLHFTATETFRRRVIQLGEMPEHVFNVGALGIENINRLKLLGKEAFEDRIALKLNGKVNLLVTFHPVTLETASSKDQFQSLLEVLAGLDDCRIIFTKANADTEGRIINQMIDEYVADKGHCVAFTSMGQLLYLSALQFVDLVVGNSSSGLVEAPSFGKVTINIGDRQKGRIKAASVIDCTPESQSIREAILEGQSLQFRESVAGMKNPYDKGNASENIVSILKKINLANILKKTFYDAE